MFDLDFIRQYSAYVDERLATRGVPPISADLIKLDDMRKGAISHLQEIQERSNTLSREIGIAKSNGDTPLAERLLAEVATLPPMADIARTITANEALMRDIMLVTPNLPADDVPIGRDAVQNRQVFSCNPRDFPVEGTRPHWQVGAALGMMDFDMGAKLSGARSTVLKGELARLARVLGQFMIDHATETGRYTEVDAPVTVRGATLEGTGQLPKFRDDLFKVEGEDRYLIPTAEVTLTGMAADQIHSADALPMRLTALTPCFRAEAGAAGRDTRGMIRQHQFTKCELVSICTPEQAKAEFDHMTNTVQQLLMLLDLPYRIMELCTGDMGLSAKRTWDFEVWMPGEGAWREISSVSWCGDYQARRMKARYKVPNERRNAFVHTLNGSGVAVGRALVAILENCQRADGSLRIPHVLVHRMGGKPFIEKAA